MAPTGDDIARCVLDAYDTLPQKCKPLEREFGSREWVPLSGIVLASPGDLRCVALGTGMKCLPTSKLPLANGNVLHDSHAEIIAVRAFNRFLLEQCCILARDVSVPSPYVRRRHRCEINENSPQLFTLNEGITIHLYGSEAPCGDASMELVMAAQDDATPWVIPPAQIVEADGENILNGRGSFSELGVVRRKPARPDAPPTLSKSCSDKLAMYQFTSVLNSLTAMFIAPHEAYLSTVTIPESQYVSAAVERAFGGAGRLANVIHIHEPGYAYRPFEVQTTSLEFQWSRRAVTRSQRAVGSNVSAVYAPDFTETLINGVLQGRRLGDLRGASKICRRSMWARAVEVAQVLNVPGLLQDLHVDQYRVLKTTNLLQKRRSIKAGVKEKAMIGWTRNAGDEDFSLD